MTARVATVECPCVRPVRTATAGRDPAGVLKPHVIAPRYDCDVCDGSGEVRQLVATAPRDVRGGES